VASGKFLAFWLDDGRVTAALNANIWDAGKELSAMVREGAIIDPERLADPGAPLTAVAA